VEKLAVAAQNPHAASSDLVKIGEFLKKVKDDGKNKDLGPTRPQFSIEISFADGQTAKVEVDVTPPNREIPILDEDDDPDDTLDLLDEVKDAIDNTDTLSYGFNFGDN
jgi:hypothetical protein